MIIFDAILLVFISGFVFYGFFFGLVRTIGSIAGVVIGAFLASHFYLEVFSLVESWFLGFDNLGRVAVFLVLFGLINKVISLAFVLLDKTFNIISIIPFLKTINRLAGAVLGFLLGCLVLGLVLYISSRYAIVGHWFAYLLVNSKLAPFFLKFSALLTPLFPEILKKLQSVI